MSCTSQYIVKSVIDKVICEILYVLSNIYSISGLILMKSSELW